MRGRRWGLHGGRRASYHPKGTVDKMAAMAPGPERQLIIDLSRGVKGTFLEGQLIVGGSSGLLAFPTETPAFTEDIDFLILEDLVAARGAEVVRLLEGLGYLREPETPTFTSPGRPAFDLVGYSTKDFSDHLSPPGFLQVMVFGDLGVVLAAEGSVETDPAGAKALSPAGFCVVKLMTVRVEKGAKDKLQALLVIAEREEDARFRQSMGRILKRFDRDRRRDAVADAQSAFLSLQQDPEFRDRGAEGYAALLTRVEAGYQHLTEILREARHG